MGRITGTTKNIISEYYKEKIKMKESELREIENEYCLNKIFEFDNDSDVIEVRKLLSIINEKYESDFEINLKRYRIEYSKSEAYQNKLVEIKDIKKERDELLVCLDYLPKNSKEYKDAIIKLNNILKGE